MIINPYIYAGSTLSTSLYAVYKGESNANDSLLTYNGTARGGLTYGTGKSGDCFVPNGTDGYVELPNNALNGLGQTFSIGFWINPSSLVVGNKTIASTYNNNAGSDYGFELDLATDGTQVFFGLFGTSNVFLSTSIGALTRNAWNFVLLERIAGTSTKIYINNSLINSNTSTVDARYYSTMYASIGALKYGASSVSQYLGANYNYDEVMFWNRELTTQEKTDLYSAGAGKFHPTF
jgi:hypothetical protein